MYKLSSSVTEVARVGPVKAKSLAKLGITHIRDFLYTFPRRYDDFSKVTPVAQLREGEKMVVRGKVKSVKTNWGWRGRGGRMLRIYADIEDETGVLKVIWFNLRFLTKQLWQGREIYVAGKVEVANQQRKLSAKKDEKISQFRMRSPVIEFVEKGQEQTHTGRITPVYSETYGVSSRWLRYQIKNLLPLIKVIPEYMPEEIRKRHKLMGIHEAVAGAHFPETSQQLARARRRLRFDELFFLQLAALVRLQQRRKQTALAVKITDQATKKFMAEFKFTFTNAQKKVMKEVAADLAQAIPMNRLLQGDVGSGKSVIAQYAVKIALDNGYKAMYLAPTEILARQQEKVLRQSLGKHRLVLLIGAMTKRQKDEIKALLLADKPLCVVGTHALLQEDVKVEDCALAIIDEQHRFGVEQRQRMQEINTSGMMAHLLSMTATPIPRTLSLTVYGDLEVSVIDELPAGRQAIETRVIDVAGRDRAVVHILEELHAGRQAYVIAPLVEHSDRLELRSATETAAEMKQLFPDIAVGLLHGRMESEEKAGVLENFSAGALQLLVATSVVEVGVNVPNATVMIIEGAERFGLSQLHQFRGRIGRGEHKSYCYLFPSKETVFVNERLQVLVKTTDGFKIAEEDLKLRGPGEVYGLAQSGFGNLRVASLLDYRMIALTRKEASNLLVKDPELKNYDILREKVKQKNIQAHFE